MNFNVSSGLLQKTVNTLFGVIASNNSMPILDNFLFKLKKGKLTILASDLETTMSSAIEVQTEDGAEGEICVPARMLTEILKTFPEMPISFKTIDEQNILEIKYGQGANEGSCDIPFESAAEYPKTPTLAKTSQTVITSDILSSAISKTLFATGNDDMRPTMNGVLFKFTPEGIIFVSTDAHKLVKYQRDDITSAETTEFVMPKKPLNMLKGILAPLACDVEVKWTDTNAMFKFEDNTLVCRLIDGKFPPYEVVIPKENPNELLIDRYSFLSSINRISLFANKTTNKIKLTLLPTEVVISAEDQDLNKKANEKVPCEYKGEDMEIGFNSKYLSEILKNLESKEVTLSMSVPSRAGIIKPVEVEDGESILMLAMPVMLNA